MPAIQLPTFLGWTIDERLREFRRVTYSPQGEPSIEILPFSSPSGDALLGTYLTWLLSLSDAELDRYADGGYRS